MSEGYCGHKNYQTWAVSLWLDNDEWSYKFWRETALEALRENGGDFSAARDDVEDALKESIEEEGDSVVDCGLMADLLRSAIDDVDFREIAEGYVGESMAGYLEETDGEEEEKGEEEDEKDNPVPVCL